MSQKTTRRAYRRTKWGAVAGAGAMAVTLYATLVPGGAGSGRPRPGPGLAIAQTERVDPRSGNLSIGITFGISIGAHQNGVAKASSQAIDLGVIGTTLAAQACDGAAIRPCRPTSNHSPFRSTPAGRRHRATRTNPHSRSRSTSTQAPTPIRTAKPSRRLLPSVSPCAPGRPRRGHQPFGPDRERSVREAKAITDISRDHVPRCISMIGLHWEVTARSDGPPSAPSRSGTPPARSTPIPTDDPSKTHRPDEPGARPARPEDRPPGRPSGRWCADSSIRWVSPLCPIRSATRSPARSQGWCSRSARSCSTRCSAELQNATYITIADIVLGSVIRCRRVPHQPRWGAGVVGRGRAATPSACSAPADCPAGR